MSTDDSDFFRGEHNPKNDGSAPMDLDKIDVPDWLLHLEKWLEDRDISAFALAVYEFKLPEDAGPEDALEVLKEDLSALGILAEYEEVTPEAIDAVYLAIDEQTPVGHDWPVHGGKELAHILIGDIPFHCSVASPEGSAKGLPEGVAMLELLETVGKRDVFTKDIATTYFSCHCLMPGRDTGERHVTTNRRVFEMAKGMGPTRRSQDPG